MNLYLPAETAAAQEQIRKLEKINRALMGRVEKSMDFSGTRRNNLKLLRGNASLSILNIQTHISHRCRCYFKS